MNPVGFESSCVAPLQPPSVPPQNSLVFDASPNMNQMVPRPYVGQMHAKHAGPSHNQNVHGLPFNRLNYLFLALLMG
ncbi:hypothetical protein F0562_005815 [Nyssa sinensis]|uniref:Uncharacterized protein n=1 Tax=Nyssa sinensis TaxID=561372 RepID=A0A5J5AN58_9ASTE|nr:hypothetical protein F0562_005815 [Nyssa sinensis]